MYGEVWGTSLAEMDMDAGLSVADSAYTQEALPLHTDMTYYMTPPGLQVFLMKKPAEIGGHSVFVDGLRVLELLERCRPRSLELLSEQVRHFVSYDDDQGWDLQAAAPVVSLFQHGGRRMLATLRHNDLDRLPLSWRHLPDSDGDTRMKVHLELYLAHALLDRIVASPALRLVLPLQAGEMAVVANHRVMHGRTAFEGSRDVIGCYLGADELHSRMRRLRLPSTCFDDHYEEYMA
mmetsp:Transcript_838/g.3480  ORF Transcript_838/g.3480 Transcript_838/m.3480 type:complete len:235 (+) Transcript_838:971-1675(+)